MAELAMRAERCRNKQAMTCASWAGRRACTLDRREGQAHDRFSLYRVHSFGLRTRVYWLDGALDQTCDLSAMSYRALPRPMAG
jgi:hypothetical protein